ncbi:MAG: hypothetical protein EA350_02985 [Gemmatimonadales bacterium]|nr:MAG: hypothetical protein EA350_02985 [Gemmatimonadales bacterium]
MYRRSGGAHGGQGPVTIPRLRSFLLCPPSSLLLPRDVMNRLGLACLLGSVFSLVVFSGCTSPLESDGPWERRIGVIEIGGSQWPPIQLPDTVRQGVPFAATVLTFGSSTCVRADGAEVHRIGRTAHVIPYDLVAVAGVCTDDLGPHPREVTLQFDQAGEAVVRVLGRTLLGASAQYEAQVLVVSGG